MPKLKRGTESKSELVTVRMHPKLRFGLELIERANSATTTEAIAIAIRQTLKTMQAITATADGVVKKPLEDVMEHTWAKDEIGRFLNLACNYPMLLLEHEQELLNMVVADERVRAEDGEGIELMGVRISEVRLREAWDSYVG